MTLVTGLGQSAGRLSCRFFVFLGFDKKIIRVKKPDYIILYQFNRMFPEVAQAVVFDPGVVDWVVLRSSSSITETVMPDSDPGR